MTAARGDGRRSARGALFPPKGSSSEPRPEPDWDGIHRQLTGKGEGKGKRVKGMTLRTLWLEYLENNPSGYQYSRFWTYPGSGAARSML